MKLSRIGESGLIDRLTGGLSQGPEVIRGVGDDTAVLQVDQEKWLLFTTDMLVEGVHFSLDYCAPDEVGWKLLAVSVSDVAAMGGRPTHAVISLAIPERLSVVQMESLYQGLKEAAAEYRVNLVGGDTVSAKDSLVLNLALLGEAPAGQVVYRRGAQPGDVVCLTGSLGASAAGLFLFQHPAVTCSRKAADYCRQAHAKPRPDAEAGILLAGLGATAMNDISDGLAAEIMEICTAGEVGCNLREGDLPIDPRVWKVAATAAAEFLRLPGGAGRDSAIAETAGIFARRWALYGGEDFKLVFTLPAKKLKAARQAAKEQGLTIYQVGTIRAGSGITLEKPDGSLIPLLRGGYEHFVSK